jgi:hypothetical protein
MARDVEAAQRDDASVTSGIGCDHATAASNGLDLESHLRPPPKLLAVANITASTQPINGADEGSSVLIRFSEFLVLP